MPQRLGTQPASHPRNSALDKELLLGTAAHGRDFQGPECEGSEENL